MPETSPAAQTHLTATYSYEDNKLRLSSLSRLDRGTYDRLREAGFKWAPKQEVFVAPAWTPERAQLLVELAGRIDDETTTIARRAADRAARFDGYSERRAFESASAQRAAHAIIDQIPLGQPVLVGHHSERHHRRDLAKVDRNLSRASELHDRSESWRQRARAAVDHADRKDDPQVRHRRIATLETELRSIERRVKLHGGTDRDTQWLAHLNARLTHERALLAADPDAPANKVPQVGSTVLFRKEWVLVLKVNKVGGRITSVTTTPPRGAWSKTWKVPLDKVDGVREPTDRNVAAVAHLQKKPPLANFPSEGGVSLTKAQWAATHAAYKGTATAGETAVRLPFRYRTIVHAGALCPVFILDLKRVDPPVPS